ncbi:MAG TPA: T9SS type A sorting domain-containing protein, partial [Candidatus Kapabacteria bacterium]|nr:T9SS type A sorting domain-containing protein [Candidatus Kapabacteria bacterium]
TGVSDAGIVARSPLENYPNPFSATTTIAFHVTHGGAVTLNIYNVLGDKVATVISQDALPGDYTIQWDARDLPRGIYFCRGILNGQEYVRALDVVK